MTDRSYEPSDIPPRGAALSIAGLLAALLLVLVIVAMLLGWIASGRPPRAPATMAQPPPPRLEVEPLQDRNRIETAARARLRGGPDRPSIEQAMRQVAASGWRDRAPAPSTIEAAHAHSGEGR